MQSTTHGQSKKRPIKSEEPHEEKRKANDVREDIDDQLADSDEKSTGFRPADQEEPPRAPGP